MYYLYVQIAAIVLSLFLPLLVDFLFILNRMTIVSPLKNNISQSNFYALKKEMRQLFARESGSGIIEFFLYSVLLFCNICVFFCSILLVTQGVNSIIGTESIIYLLALPSAFVLMSVLKYFNTETKNFPALLTEILFKITATSLISCFIVICSKTGAFHKSTVLFIMGVQLFFYYSCLNNHASTFEQRPFKRNCFSGARIGLNSLTLLVLLNYMPFEKRPELVFYIIVFSTGIEIASKIFKTTWPLLDIGMNKLVKKTVQITLILSIMWRLI